MYWPTVQWSPNIEKQTFYPELWSSFITTHGYRIKVLPSKTLYNDNLILLRWDWLYKECSKFPKQTISSAQLSLWFRLRPRSSIAFFLELENTTKSLCNVWHKCWPMIRHVQRWLLNQINQFYHKCEFDKYIINFNYFYWYMIGLMHISYGYSFRNKFYHIHRLIQNITRFQIRLAFGLIF